MFAFSHEFNSIYIVVFSLFAINKHDDDLLAEERSFFMLCLARFQGSKLCNWYNIDADDGISYFVSFYQTLDLFWQTKTAQKEHSPFEPSHHLFY
jgi:hypothetical protein